MALNDIIMYTKSVNILLILTSTAVREAST